MRGPLPGPRQTNNRAEIWALLSVLQNSQGLIIYWTDSEVLMRNWRRKRHRAKKYHFGNGDIWMRIKGAIDHRGGGDECITIRHMQSHLEWEDARRRDIPEWAWLGNRAADEQADAAAE
eukprot:1315848-Pyramimonas_sp.AAC.1